MSAKNEQSGDIQNEISRRGFLQGALGVGVGIATQWGAAAMAQEAALPASSPAQTSSTGRPVIKKMPVAAPVEAHLHLNQVGYLPHETKRCVIAASGPIPGNAFHIVDDDVIPSHRYPGTLVRYGSTERYGHYEYHFIADFSEFTHPGRYRLRLSDGRLSAPFSIGKDVYSRLVPLVLSYFDVQKCGKPRTDRRNECHADDGVIVGGPRDGQPIDGSGGWHDAGDYLKFVETTSYVTALMLFTYQNFPEAFPQTTRHGSLPVLLDQARVGLDWLLKMHPSPKEFYYQVGSERDHDVWRLPEEDCAAINKDWKPRQVLFGVGANLAGRTAAAFAMASRLYRPYDARFAERCLKAAQTSYQLGLENRNILTTSPSDYYPETTWEDDMEWGAAALYQATNRQEYLDLALEFSRKAGASRDVTSVYNTHALAHYTLYPFVSLDEKARLIDHLHTEADLARKQAQNPYGLGARYAWGTAEAAAGAAISCMLYARLSPENRSEFEEIARMQRDFILGCNPFGLCCLIGAGTRYPLFPHHQIANIKNMELSGAIVGGPADYKTFQSQNIALTQADFGEQLSGPPLANDLPDEVGIYHDAVQDYVTNEPANDYTAKFLLLTAFYI